MVSARFSQLFALVTCLFATLFFWMMLAVGGGGTRMRVAYLKTVFSFFFLMVWSLGRHPSNIAGDRTPRRPADHQKEMQIAVVWSCLLFLRSGQNHLARHGERGKKTRQIEAEVGRQHQGMHKPGVRQVPKGSGEQGKMEKTDCKIICGAQTTLAIKELMMMMMTH